MTLAIDSLNRILKDKTRRKIVLLLNEKSSLTYTELMDAVKISSTGTLNYHLKVLGDLLEKNDAGQYMLNEKGKLAARFLIEFPEQEKMVASVLDCSSRVGLCWVTVSFVTVLLGVLRFLRLGTRHIRIYHCLVIYLLFLPHDPTCKQNTANTCPEKPDKSG